MKSSKSYHRIQIGYAMLGLAVTAEVFLILSFRKYGNPVGCVLLTLVLGFLSACFFSLQVIVDNTAIRLKFGVGLIQKEIPLEQILSCSRVKNFFFSGWGVRRIGRTKGWSYSVSGWDAVELTLASGQRIKIGTADPDGLFHAILEKIR